ncbi:MAG: glyoxalase [Hyphococcus sp.]|nr:MAG: glyoxalase [Marinicaulis sp.]
MKRLHLHIRTNDLDRSIDFYTAMFGTAPTVQKDDYAKWLLVDPAANISLSTHGTKTGIDHAGLSLDDDKELEAVAARLEAAGVLSRPEADTTCCYAKSNKYWTQDPQMAVWELFHTYGESGAYGSEPDLSLNAAKPKAATTAACC